MKKEKAFLIDGNAFCYRAFYAIRALSTSRGRPTNAIYGFVTMLQKLVEEEKPDYLAVSFDLPGETFRKKEFEAYKSHRKPMPDDLADQIPMIKEILRLYGIPIFEKEGYEADDVLATVSKKLAGRGLSVYIVTGDKDILQLVSDRIFVYHSHKEGLIYDTKRVRDEFGVAPEEIVELIGLCGDASDNIPGVPGIGEKTAVALIQKFGSLERLLSHLDEVEGESQRRCLEEHAEQARFSRKLAVVDPAVPLEVLPEQLRIKEPDREGLYRLFKELEFRSLLARFAPESAAKGNTQVLEAQSLSRFFAALEDVKRFAFHIDTGGEDDPAQKQKMEGISFSWNEGSAYYLPLKENSTALSELLGRLKAIFEDETVGKIGQNVKEALILLAKIGIPLRGICFDTGVASYLLNPSEPDHGLEAIALEYLDIQKSSMAEAADLIFRLSQLLEKELRSKGMLELFEHIELPLIEVLASMESAGVCIDVKYLGSLSEEMEGRLQKLTRDVYEMADCSFNINSPKQLQEVLFKKLKLPILKRTKTGASTDAWVLENLALIHPLPKTLVQYRELSKLKSTYVDALPRLVDPRTKRVHTSYNQTVTATGRLSSSNPNLQNIPIRTEEGRKIRKAFLPRQGGWILVSFDYSQIELRILAHLSKDETLREAFRKERDVHRWTASLLYGVKEKDVEEAMRKTAKTVNFGIIYGMSPFGLSRDLGIDSSDAKHFIDAYFDRYPKVKSYIEKQMDTAREEGFVSTLFNRRRFIPEIRSKNVTERQFGERIAVNAPIQGTASDLIKIAMIEIYRELKRRGAKAQMILQVHDELVFDMPEEEERTLTPMIAEKMEKGVSLSVPILVTVKRGNNWMEMA